jgi:hypothetical protein
MNRIGSRFTVQSSELVEKAYGLDLIYLGSVPLTQNYELRTFNRSHP